MRSVRLFAYETYMLQHRRAFAKTKDTEKSLILILAAGKGVIVDAYAKDLAGTKITKAAPGTKLKITVDIRNDGDDDYIWYTVKDKDTGTIIDQPAGVPFLRRGEHLVRTGAEQTMPNKTWNLLVEAGHGR